MPKLIIGGCLNKIRIHLGSSIGNQQKSATELGIISASKMEISWRLAFDLRLAGIWGLSFYMGWDPEAWQEHCWQVHAVPKPYTQNDLVLYMANLSHCPEFEGNVDIPDRPCPN
jgi:hypothetical protein